MRHMEQLSLTQPWIDHEHAVDLAAISQILDAHPAIANMVQADLLRNVKHSKRGAPGLTGDQVLRVAITQCITGDDYRALAFRLADSASYRTFCRLSALESAPVFQTLQTNVAKLRPETLDAIHRVLIGHAITSGVETGERIRVDTTPVLTNIHEPSDSTLLFDCVRVLTRLCKQARKCIGFQDFKAHTCAAKRRMIAIQYAKPQATDERARLYSELIDLTQSTLGYAETALVHCLSIQTVLESQPAGFPVARLERLTRDITKMTELTTRVVDQTKRRVLWKEAVPASEKVVSIFEPHTDIIVKDNRETIFGHKIVLTEGTSRLILDYRVLDGNPADSTLAVPAIVRLKERYHITPKQVAYDGGFASGDNLAAVKALGVSDVCFTKARGLAVEAMVRDSRTYRALRRFRAGIESAISRLKRAFGLARCSRKGSAGFLRYVHTSMITANLLVLAQHLRA